MCAVIMCINAMLCYARMRCEVKRAKLLRVINTIFGDGDGCLPYALIYIWMDT